MASLQKISTGHYHITFRFAGQRYKRSLKTKRRAEADARRVRLEDTLRLVESGRIDVPEDVDIASFLLADGKITSQRPRKKTEDAIFEAAATLEATFDAFFAAIPDGNLEESTLTGMHQHRRHLLRLIGWNFPIQKLTLDSLQTYVNKRCKEKTHYATRVSAVTIHKELVTLGTVWRWAENVNMLHGTFPRRGIRLPKTSELPPFQTWEEIERKISQDHLDDAQASVHWDALYLRRREIDALLSHVKEVAGHPFIYPMFVMAAHTGARRSELLRSRRSDFDFDAAVVTIHEKKRVRGRATTRRVSLSDVLQNAMAQWIETDHPGGSLTFSTGGRIARSRTSRPREGLSPNQAYDHFRRTLNGSKWDKIKGWHCLRHSFISNLASNGVDQRIIDDFVGHTTEAMRRRYRHLFPNVKQAAIEAVFGSGLEAGANARE